MKNKNNHHKHMSIHQRVESFCHHRALLITVLSIMSLAFVKYQTHLTGMMQTAYTQGLGVVGTYAYQHDEVNRMPVNCGVTLRTTTSSGE